MAKKPAKRKAGKKSTKKKTSARKAAKKKPAGKKKAIKKVTIADLGTTSEFGGRHKARVVRRPLMRDIRVDQKRVHRSQREDMRSIRPV